MRRPILREHRGHILKQLLPWILPMLRTVLLAGILLLWLRSYFVTDVLRQSHISLADDAFGRREVCLMTVRGGIATRTWISITATLDPPDPEIPPPSARTFFAWTYSTRPPWHPLDPSGGPASFAEHLGFVRRPGIRAVPMWIFALLAAATFLPQLRRWRMRVQRRRRGLCTVCGFDLRASTKRCPECGADILANTPPAQR